MEKNINFAGGDGDAEPVSVQDPQLVPQQTEGLQGRQVFPGKLDLHF